MLRGIAGSNETRLCIYYYKEGTLHVCRETGAYPDENIAWAYMYEDEVTGSPIIIAKLHATAAFQISDLSVPPSEVAVSEAVAVSVKVSDVG